MSGTAPSAEARLLALCEITRTITSSLSLDAVLSGVCSRATDLFHAEHSIVTMLEGPGEGGTWLEVRVSSPEAQELLGQRLELESSLSGRVISEGRTLIANDVPTDHRADHSVASRIGVRQAIVSPLRFGNDEPIGTLVVFNTEVREAFDASDAVLLETLAAHAAVAIRNARAFEKGHGQLEELAGLRADLEQNVHRLRGLVRAGMALNSQLALDEVLQTLVDSARDVIGARYAALGVLDAAGTALSAFVFSGIDRDTADRIGPLPTGRGILGLIIRRGKTLRLRDLHEHPSSCGFPDGHPEMSSFLGVPVRAGGRVFGNLYLTEKEGAAEFTAEDEELAELLAAQAAVAIENAHLNEQRNQFLAIVNHEIKNAAAGLLGWSDRLRSLSAGAERRIRESCEYIHEGARHLHKLVVDLLDLSRIEARSLELDARPVDLRALIREVAGAARPDAERLGVELRIEGLDRRAVTETDPTRVRQILLNLLSNALKFSDEGGRIDLRLAPENGGWAIIVTDTGPGVAPDVGDDVFEAYRNVAIRRRQAGAGLGLAISRRLARLLGGELSLQQRDAPGAAFRLDLPERSGNPR